MGDGNASVERAQPVTTGPFFGGLGTAPRALAIRFISSAARETIGPRTKAGRWEAVRATRGVRKQDMVRNGALPNVLVDPDTLEATLDGAPLRGEPAAEVPMNRLYLLS